MANCQRIVRPFLRHRANPALLSDALSVRRQSSQDVKPSSAKWTAPVTAEELDRIESNLAVRQHNNNIPLIRTLIAELTQHSGAAVDTQTRLQAELRKLPNATHPRLLAYGTEPRELMTFVPRASSTQQSHEFKEFSEICRRFNLCRMDHLGNYTGHKSYYLMGQLASLEQALVQYTLTLLKAHNFRLISVPDILPGTIIESCGMQIEGERSQVYKLDSGHCLSGTSEMALAGFFANETISAADLPIKVAAVSRCYRAETSGLHEEKGIYRVHQFTKVEMFAVCAEQQSESILEDFKDTEVDLFRKLDLHFRLLDMPPFELGTPAYQKYDIEAWMPGRQMWGEISSCSNCTDYQAKRLNIRYESGDKQLKYAHTVNGTAAAIPRLLIALIESNQTGRDAISIPTALRPFMKAEEIKKDKNMPEVKLVKSIKA